MNKKLNSVMMALVVIMCFSFTSVYADSASDKANIQQVQVQRRNLESKVEIMNSQLKTIMAKINKNEKNITIAQKDIKQTKVNLVKAEVDIKAEQIIFDKRMRAIYMNGSSSYIDIMLGANGIDDFISRLENIKTIVTFDQKAISDMKTKEASINLKKVALEKGNTKLLSLRADNKEDLAILTKQKSDQNLLALKLDALENKYGAQLVIDEAIAARQALAAKQVGKSVKAASSNTVQDSTITIKNAAIKYTASDLDLLARLITAEAGGESYNAQVAVGAVVINRVRSGSFPNSISAVINEKANGVYQFTPVLNGNINRTAQAGTMKAAIEALSGTDPTNNSMYFYSGSTPPGSPKSASIRIDHLTFLGM
ncbi:cell wall hydrolase [Clostridium estertheticum]|uniref:cell wall hydrolase n=1 Tax=Clostridium estertheticum TaxID=238834 RepID=UPI001CF16642|nr:cell wall hydrolase [Clostridium estertheticum]MCB2308158.1 cell wall hydrolase [Clostridium estertheticum]MCB2346263.1 cell wall hydrolase [Clostridium estertheticum]MCB2349545.1 cell wall hydrolase [Clostridium estertheticum]WAG46516.1 cell wall hydrolase [Clostridium estertheticum]